MNQKLEAIRQKCIEANPEIMEEEPVPFRGKEKECWLYDYRDENGINWHSEPFETREDAIEHAINSGHFKTRPIRLADVLLAYTFHSGNQGNWSDSDWRKFVYPLLQSLVNGWNLRQDDLERQSPETIAFIGSVLGV